MPSDFWTSNRMPRTTDTNPEVTAMGPSQTPPVGGGTPTISATGGDIEQQLRTFFKSRGVSDQEVPYWVQKWQEFGAKDPAYFNQRLAQADIFGGGGGSAPGGGGAGDFSSGTFGGYPNPYQIPTFTAPKPYEAPTFTAPTGLDYTNDPGFRERMKMGTEAIQGAAAAKGSLLSGGTLKALERYGQDYGSNEFGNVYNRARDTFGTNAALGLQGYQLNAANDWRRQENQAQYGLTGYMTNVGTRRNAEQDYWGRLQDLYRGGLSAAPLTYQRP